jgi:hypothetical protein
MSLPGTASDNFALAKTWCDLTGDPAKNTHPGDFQPGTEDSVRKFDRRDHGLGSSPFSKTNNDAD